MRAAILGVLALVGCAYWDEDSKKAASANEAKDAPPAQVKPSPNTPTGTQLLKLVGSTTIGGSLAPKLVAAYMKKNGVSDVAVTPGQNTATVAGKKGDQTVTVRIDYPGSSAGFKAIGDGSADIAMSSRPIKPDESASLHATEVVIAMDGIAVVVNKQNNVGSLTMSQLADVFGGRAKSWSDVGGGHAPIHVYGRDEVSGTYELFSQLVLGGRAPTGNKEQTSDQIVSDVSGDKDAIGYVGLGYIKDLKPVALQDGDGPAVVPSTLTVSTESYGLSRRLFFYVPDNAKNTDTQQFVQFTLSDEGQEIVGSEGFVSLNAIPVETQVPAGAPPEYKQLVSGAKRLPFDLRFRSGTSELDGKGRADVQRAAKYVNAQGSGHELITVGFADRSGAEPQNIDLSKARARAAADAFKQLAVGGNVQSSGFGSALPVAPNDSDRGRERNRRVEVWLR